MAEKQQRSLDVWIVESNTVYKGVPYTVVVNWIQEGRLLEDDQVRTPSTKEWRRIADIPGLAVYLPKAEPLRATDQAEALESVELDFVYKKPLPDEDEDVDMIPLIDVSLVLLIFFMITAASGGAAAFIKTPPANIASIANTTGIWIGVNLEGNEGKNQAVVYSLGEEGRASPDPEDRNIRTKQELLQRLDALLAKKTAKVDVTIQAHEDCEDGLVVDLTIELSKKPRRDKILAKYTGVTEKLP